MMISRGNAFFVSRHTFTAGGQHLTGVLLPDVQRLNLLRKGNILIVEQIIGRPVV
jgi:hypothetical protein